MARWNPFGKKDKPAETSPENVQQESLATEVPTVTSDSPVSPAPVTPPSDPADAPLPAAESSDDTATEGTQAAGIFGRFRKALKKTVDVLNTDIRDLVGKEGRLVDQEFLDELFAHLIKTDMGTGPAGMIRDDIQSTFRGRKVMMSDLISSAKTTIQAIMEQDSAELNIADSGPTVVMVVGVNGAGKTTSIAKLAHQFISEGKSVVLGAGDTFRAAAVEQLTIWSERMGAEIVTGRQGSDPASVAYKATEAAKNNDTDICIVDTAGRLQTQSNLMEELGRIRRVVGKVIPEAPHEVLLVLDATAGQNAISQARGFSDAAGCTGIILAKLDGTAKGGVAIPIQQEFDLPVKFVGLGETPDAFAQFDVDEYVNALFDDADE